MRENVVPGIATLLQIGIRSNLLITRIGINYWTSLKFSHSLHFTLKLLSLECLNVPSGPDFFQDMATFYFICRNFIKIDVFADD